MRDAGSAAGSLAQQGEAERLREARVMTTTFQKAQKAEEQLDQVVRDPRTNVETRVAMASSRKRFGNLRNCSCSSRDVAHQRPGYYSLIIEIAPRP